MLQPGNAGASKDVLFGWLVGRAAADLGLAQALAASESAARGQIQTVGGWFTGRRSGAAELAGARLCGAARQNDELEQLKAAMQSIFERMGGLESLAQQFTQAPELLKHEVARLQAGLGGVKVSLKLSTHALKKLPAILSPEWSNWKIRNLRNLKVSIAP